MNNKNFKETELGKIPEDWEENTIVDNIAHKKGFAFKSIWYQKNGKRIVKVSDFTDRSVDLSDCIFIDETKANEFKEYELNENDIVIATVGSWPNNPASIVGKVIKIPKEASGSLLNQNAVIIRTKNNAKIDQIFLFYRFRNKDFSDYLISGAQGSANQASITLNDIFNFEFSLPTYNEQQAIAKILSDLDAKIELNRQMNKTLEQIAEALFKRWFVDFEFPNEEGKPYKSSGGKMIESEMGVIPSGWVIVKLGTKVSVVKGVSYRSDELKESDKALVTLKSMNRGGGLNKNGFKEFIGEYKKEQEIIDGDIVVAYTDLTQKAEVIGRPAIVRKISKYTSLIASLDLAIIRPKDEQTNNSFFYYLLGSENFQNHVQGFTNGTTVLHLSSKAIPEYILAFPHKELISKFGEITQPLLNRKKDNEVQTEVLIQIRDSLLPKLMSGEIRVK